MTILGITGYVGSHTCLAFLVDRGFKVRGTVRDKRDTVKLKGLQRACMDLWSELEIVEADLLDQKSLKNAIKGSAFVIVTAFPKVYEDHTRIE